MQCFIGESIRPEEISTFGYFMELTYFNNSYYNFLALEKEYNQVVTQLYKFAL